MNQSEMKLLLYYVMKESVQPLPCRPLKLPGGAAYLLLMLLPITMETTCYTLVI